MQIILLAMGFIMDCGRGAQAGSSRRAATDL